MMHGQQNIKYEDVRKFKISNNFKNTTLKPENPLN
jgi:hypothetical protein